MSGSVCVLAFSQHVKDCDIFKSLHYTKGRRSHCEKRSNLWRNALFIFFGRRSAWELELSKQRQAVLPIARCTRRLSARRGAEDRHAESVGKGGESRKDAGADDEATGQVQGNLRGNKVSTHAFGLWPIFG
jgi:hypothetical protein